MSKLENSAFSECQACRPAKIVLIVAAVAMTVSLGFPATEKTKEKIWGLLFAGPQLLSEDFSSGGWSALKDDGLIATMSLSVLVGFLCVMITPWLTVFLRRARPLLWVLRGLVALACCFFVLALVAGIGPEFGFFAFSVVLLLETLGLILIPEPVMRS